MFFDENVMLLKINKRFFFVTAADIESMDSLVIDIVESKEPSQNLNTSRRVLGVIPDKDVIEITI